MANLNEWFLRMKIHFHDIFNLYFHLWNTERDILNVLVHAMTIKGDVSFQPSKRHTKIIEIRGVQSCSWKATVAAKV